MYVYADTDADTQGGSNANNINVPTHVLWNEKNFYDSWERKWRQHAGVFQDKGLLRFSVSF